MWMFESKEPKTVGVLTACLFATVLAGTARAAGRTQQPPYNWRGIDGSGVFPAEGLVSEFWYLAEDMTVEAKDRNGDPVTLELPGKPGTKKNIVWRTTLPHWGHSSPVVVGKRVFLTTEEGWQDDAPQLVCVDAEAGKILWKGAVDHLDAWPAEKAAEGRKVRARSHELWRKFMRQWNRCFWDNRNNSFAWHSREESEKLIAEARQAGFAFAETLKSRNVNGVEMVSWPTAKARAYGWRCRFYWTHGTAENEEEYRRVFETCARKRYHVRPGWTSEGPYYGSSFASVVSDGQYVYAVCHPDAVSCYDLEGNRRWSADLELGGRLDHPYELQHTDIASPVLVNGMLIVFSAGRAVVTGLDCATGKRLWRTPCPRPGKNHPDWRKGKTQKPLGFCGHMGPGGTPVIMNIGNDTTVVCANGLVLRVSDGAMLHQAGIPRVLSMMHGLKEVRYAHWKYGSSYCSWVAHGDSLFGLLEDTFCAIRIAPTGTRLQTRKEKTDLAFDDMLDDGAGDSADLLSGETAATKKDAPDPLPLGPVLPQKLLWHWTSGVSGSGPNAVFHNGRLYVSKRAKHKRGVAVVDPATGKVVKWGPSAAGGRNTILAFGRKRAIWLTRYIGDGGEGKRNPATTPGHGMLSYLIVSLPDLAPLGQGHLCPEAPAGEVAERHIACIGTARVIRSHAGVTCWGNRIFVRGNDYLWCIGDPDVAYIPPERFLEK